MECKPFFVLPREKKNHHPFGFFFFVCNQPLKNPFMSTSFYDHKSHNLWHFKGFHLSQSCGVTVTVTVSGSVSVTISIHFNHITCTIWHDGRETQWYEMSQTVCFTNNCSMVALKLSAVILNVWHGFSIILFFFCHIIVGNKFTHFFLVSIQIWCAIMV